MPLKIIPAMDLMDGGLVRLRQGDFEKVTNYSTDPIVQARRWEELGAKRLHLVNLSGARGDDTEIIKIEEVIKNVNLPIQVGGGIRSKEIVERLLSLRDRISLMVGTSLFETPEEVANWIRHFGRESFIGDVAFKEGQVLTRGWQAPNNFGVNEGIQRAVDLGIRKFVITNRDKDGALNGCDDDILDSIKSNDVEIIISGGVANLGDIKKIQDRKDSRVSGVVVGRRLYEVDGETFFNDANKYVG